MGLKLKGTKVMKCGNKEKLDKAVYLWFKQKRMEVCQYQAHYFVNKLFSQVIS